MGKIIELENQTVETLNEVLTTNQLVLVDFMASWCGPCKAITPVLENISKDNDVLIVKLDVDKNDEIASNSGIRNVPTLKLYKNGVLSNTTYGMKNKQQLLDFINS